MSFQASDETTHHNSGSWKKIDGRLVFVEENYMTSSESSIHHNKSTVNTEKQSSSPVSTVHNMNIDLDNILNRLLKLEDDIKSVKIENSILQKKVNNNKKEFEYQQEYIYALEIDINRLNQYGRRQNIEISGIPSTVRDEDLENEVLKILNTMGLNNLDHYGIVGCHRIGKRDRQGNRNAIVRFLHRKDAIFILKNKRNARLCNELGYYRLIE